MKNLKVLFTVLCVACATTVWGEDFTTSYSYGNFTGWSLTNYSDKSSYYLVPSGTSPSVATISGIFTNKTITSDVVITINCATYGSGNNPSASTFSVYAEDGCTTSITATQSGKLPTSSTYTDVVYTITKQNTTNLTKDLAIKITKPGKQIRLKSVTVVFSYTDSSGSGETTVSFTPSSIGFGTVTVGETKTQDVSVTIDNPTSSVNFSVTGSGLSVLPSSLSQNGTVTVTYKPTTAGTLNGTLTASGGGLTTDVTASITATAQASTTTYYTVTWKVGSDNLQTTQVAHGSKAIPPITPNDNALSCANTFMGWSKQEIVNEPLSVAPTDLFKDESTEAITSETTFHAVFATKKDGN